MTLKSKLWLLWLALTLSGAAALIASMLHGGALRRQLLIGKTTAGHHQIEAACEACHTTPFGGAAALQKACLNCHEAELKLAKDSHPAKKFRDPRNADRLKQLNAMLCVTCHKEHNPAITGAMGVTLPADFCFLCHQDVGKDRPSHQGLAFTSCASAGCHNYHDNRALYEDFLEKHTGEPDHKTIQRLALKNWTPPEGGAGKTEKPKPLAREAADAPPERPPGQKLLDEWHQTAHAKAGVNCSACHAPKSAASEQSAWSDKPGQQICAACHKQEAATFVEGKHGMRLRPGLKQSHEGLWGFFKDEPLSPMRPELAQIPLAAKAHGTQLVCTTCHAAHAFDRGKAQVEGCLRCHTDQHSKAYLGSPHHKLWLAEQRGELPPGSGVSCAACHMPRLKQEDDYGRETVLVTHNQNDNLKPNEKMVRPVCADCHGLQFTLNSLADPALIERNFTGRPAVHIPSIDWVAKRLKEKGAAK